MENQGDSARNVSEADQETAERTTTQEVQSWIYDNIGPTVFKKRRDAFSE